MGQHNEVPLAFGYLAAGAQERMLALARVDQQLHLALCNAIRCPIAGAADAAPVRTLDVEERGTLCASRICRARAMGHSGRAGAGTAFISTAWWTYCVSRTGKAIALFAASISRACRGAWPARMATTIPAAWAAFEMIAVAGTDDRRRPWREGLRR